MASIAGAGTVNNMKGVVPYLAPEPDEFDVEAARFRSGEIDETRFTPWRLRRGVYGQRQPDAQMMRVKIPAGLVNVEQLEALAEVAERYAPLKKGHITTRENIQFHHIKLEDASRVVRPISPRTRITLEASSSLM